MLRRMATLAVTAVSLAGCSNFRDAFTAHADVVARAAGQELTVSRLAELLAPQKQVPLRRDVVDRVADIWVDVELLAQAVAQGDSLTDEATALAASWPVVTQMLASQLHDTLITAKATLTDAQVDSAYSAGQDRWLEHILVAVRQDTTPAVLAAKRRLAEGYLAQLRSGSPFGRLASQRSDDRATALNGGSLGLVGRGMLVRAFEDTAWTLRPGQTSGIVETSFGFHIIRRPALPDVRDSFRIRLKERAIGLLDSIFLDSLANKTGIAVRGAAPGIVRSAVTDLRSAKSSGRVLATYRGGRLRASDFARWFQAYPAQTRQLVLQADDSTLKEFVRSLARNELLLLMVREHNIQLRPDQRDSIVMRFRGDFAQLVAAIGVSADSLAADTVARHSRAQAAAQRVDAFFTGVMATPPTRPFMELPPALSDVLRERMPWSISLAGVDRALERAKEIRGPETPRSDVPMMTPAPGGPPMSGGAPRGGAPQGGQPPRQ